MCICHHVKVSDLVATVSVISHKAIENTNWKVMISSSQEVFVDYLSLSSYLSLDKFACFRLNLILSYRSYVMSCLLSFQAKELNQWKVEEGSRFKQSRISEEAALAMAEMEKAKGRAAVEAAQKSQRLAEIEAKRRKYAELKARRETEEKNLAINDLSRNEICYRKYTIEEIEKTTKSFSNSEKIGEGGYGPVYKGKLDHTPVAIKVLRSDAAQGMQQFKQEVC